jgi:hypothetical protein
MPKHRGAASEVLSFTFTSESDLCEDSLRNLPASKLSSWQHVPSNSMPACMHRATTRRRLLIAFSGTTTTQSSCALQNIDGVLGKVLPQGLKQKIIDTMTKGVSATAKVWVYALRLFTEPCVVLHRELASMSWGS